MSSALYARLRALASKRVAVLLAAVVGVIVGLPSVAGGIAGDDEFIRAAARRSASLSLQSIDLFANRNPAPYRSMINAKAFGTVPWYTRDDFQVTFFRPLASFTHWLDYRLIDGSPWLMHVENLLWYAVGIALLGAAYRRLHRGAAAAGLGVLIFAVDPAHVVPVAWIANRNALMALCFGLVSLIAHDRWVRGRSRPAAALAILSYGAALLCAEIGISTFAYLLAHAVWLDGAKARRRLLHLLPYVLVTVAWRALWRALDCGARGSLVYVDALATPLRFLKAALHRGPILLASQLGAPRSDWVSFATQDVIVLAAVASMLLVVLSTWAMRERLRASPELRFWATGAVLAVVPVCSVQANDRNLLFVGIGASIVVADVIDASLATPDPSAPRPKRALRWLGWVLLLPHVVLPPILFPLEATWWTSINELMAGRAADQLFEAAGTAKGIAVLRAGDMFTCPMHITLAYVRGSNHGRLATCLSGGPSDTTVERVDAHTIVIHPDGGFFDAASNGLHWDGRIASVGDTWQLPGFRARVREVSRAGDPTSVEFVFPFAVDDPLLALVVWDGRQYVRVYLRTDGERRRFSHSVL